MVNNVKNNTPTSTRLDVVDLFCGVGGLSYGLKKQGFNIVAGFDIDASCQFAYEYNNKAKFIAKDIKSVDPEDVSSFSGNGIRVLAGCAPCQPFSSYAFKNKKKDPNKYDLLYEFSRLVEAVRPDIVTMENVPQIMDFKEKPVLEDFKNALKKNGYDVSVYKIFCPDYGIPQSRKRVVLLASRFGNISLLPPTHNSENYVTVRDTIGKLRPIQAGEIDCADPLHRAKRLSDLNLKRISNTPYGGSWKDWPKELWLECHKSVNGKSYGSVYGRMVWEKPAPTMTTQCTGLGSGRFGHPTQDRAISAREAALFQTFPKSYKFFKNETEISITKVSRYIGNAVPPRLGEVIGKSILNHLRILGKI